MHEPTGRDKDKLVVLTFRHRLSRMKALEAIQHEQGHRSISDTLRAAVDEYIERWKKAA